MTGLSRSALAVYEGAGAALAARYDAVDADAVFAPVAVFLPPPPEDALDVGAGSGRDARWLAARGYRVTAAEPTAALREAGRAAAGEGVAWTDAALPGLPGLAGGFGLVLVNAVWHHLDDAERNAAARRLAGLLRPGGRLLLSLRQGPDLPGQPVAPVRPADEIARAAAAGLRCLNDIPAPARGDAPGVAWHWLVLERSPA
jgi:SAM-dependent methyltransferase